MPEVFDYCHETMEIVISEYHHDVVWRVEYRWIPVSVHLSLQITQPVDVSRMVILEIYDDFAAEALIVLDEPAEGRLMGFLSNGREGFDENFRL